MGNTKGFQKNLPKTMNQYRNKNPDDDTERFCKYQIHRKTRDGDLSKKPFYQGLIMIPADIRRKIKPAWDKGDVLVVKYDEKNETLLIRKLNHNNQITRRKKG